MRNTHLFALTVVLVFLIGMFVLNHSVSSSAGVSPPAVFAGEAQGVVLSQDGYNYKDAQAKAGKPISLSADSSVGGCLRAVVFDLEGRRYSKYLRTTTDTLDLPALPKGTYSFSCTMGMGFGKLVVK